MNNKVYCKEVMGEAAWNKTRDACQANSLAGVCNNFTSTTFGEVVCGGASDPSIIQLFTASVRPKGAARNVRVNDTNCFRCSLPLGSVRVLRSNRTVNGQTVLSYRTYRNLNMCSPAAASGCFPGGATAVLASGARVALRDLAVGDSVRVARADGALAFSPVVFFDHALDGGDKSAFVRLGLADGRALDLTGGHFVPVGASMAAATMKRARDVEAGDLLLVAPAATGNDDADDAAATVTPVAVVAVGAVERSGMFAPVTAEGTVVVDGVVASCYSDWVLDPLFDALGLAHRLPAAMHAVHAPLRAGYAVLGARALRVLSPLISGIAQLDARQIAAGFGLAASA